MATSVVARLLDGVEQVVLPGRLLAPANASMAAEALRERASNYYLQFGPPVYRRCLRLLRDPEEAKDATQEVFIKLLRDLDRFEDKTAALRWTYRVATNHCLNVLRDRDHRQRSSDGVSTGLALDENAADYPAQSLAHQVLDRFDAQTQAIAVGVFVDGMKHEEVAELLGISRRTVSRKLERFLDKAKRFLARSES